MFRALRNNKGATLILFAFMIVALLGIAAVAIDTGSVAVERQKLQNAVDAASLAAAQALPNTTEAIDAANKYITLNGFTPSDISVTFSDSNRTVVITSNKVVNYTFAQIFGLTSTAVTPSARAQCGSLGNAFNYVLFSGSKTSTLTLNGSTYTISGSVHTNAAFTANGSSLTITGACEASKTITVNGGSCSIANRFPNSPYVSMPDFSDTIMQQAQAAGQYYTGNKTFNGSSIDVTEPLYVNGSITINGSKFKGVGCIFATGAITFNGSSMDMSSSDAVCIYSQSGNIIVNGSAAQVDGILYAPGGTVTLNGSNQVVNGRVIGNTAVLNGSNIRIIGGTKELSSLPAGVVKLIN